MLCCGAIAVSDIPRRDQLCISVDRCPSPDVARALRRLLCCRDSPLFAIVERPNFVDLDALARQVPQSAILVLEGPRSKLATAIGDDFKGNVSLALYVAALPLAFVRPWIAEAIYAAVALMWLVPDRRIESKVNR